MSADNGFVIRKDTRGKFVLQEYSASADYYPPINSPRAEKFDSLNDAAMRYSEIVQTGHVIEYGLNIYIDEPTPDGILDEAPDIPDTDEPGFVEDPLFLH